MGPDSDVYVYEHVGGGFCCCSCLLDSPRGGWFETDTAEGMVEHLREHIAVDHKVPARTIPRLEGDPEWQTYL